MAKNEVDAKKIREIIRLGETGNLASRRIARELNVPRPVVEQYLSYLSANRLTYEQIKEMTDSQLVAHLEKQKIKTHLENEDNFEINIPHQLLSRVEFIERIYKRRERIKDHLEITNYGLSAWTKTPNGKTISKGCLACKAGTWFCFYIGRKCNAECVYCPQGTIQEKMKTPERPGYINDKYHIDEYMDIMNDPGELWYGLYTEGISYSGGEPFLYLDKALKMAEFISKNHNHIYQWIYTNGLLVTEDKLKALYDKGVKEIRFHLGATNFNEKVLKNLEMAKKVMDHVNIESPSNPALKEFLLDKKGIHWLEGIGVDQINLGELTTISLDETNRAYWDKFSIGYKRLLEFFQKHELELYFYDSKIGKSVLGKDLTEIYISPTISREITYDIMEYAIENKVDILVNDCSQDAKHNQRLQRNFHEHIVGMMINNWFEGEDYVKKLQKEIDEQRLDIIREHNRPHTKEWMMMLLKDSSYEDGKGFHLRLGPYSLCFPHIKRTPYEHII